MVDAVSGQGASLAARLGLTGAGGRDPVTGRVEPAGVEAPTRARSSDDASPVSEGREAARSMAAAPPVDTARVAELRDAIAGGRYQADPERIADAMLRSEQGPLKS